MIYMTKAVLWSEFSNRHFFRQKHGYPVEEGRRREEQQRVLAERVLVEKEGEVRQLRALLEDERRQRESADRRFDQAQADLRELSQRLAESLDDVTKGRQQQATLHVENLLESQRELLEMRFRNWADQQRRDATDHQEWLVKLLDGAILPLLERIDAGKAELAFLSPALSYLSQQIEHVSKALHQQQVRDRKAKPVRIRDRQRRV